MSLTVLQAARKWLDHIETLVKVGKREEVTHDKYRSHIENHVARFDIAHMKLSRLRTPNCQTFVDELSIELSHEMTVKVRSTLKTALGFAARKGWLVGNPMRETELEYVDREDDRVVIPEKAEVGAILETAERQAVVDKGRALALLTTGFLCGLRPSELLALECSAVNLARQNPGIRVSQRIDKRAKIGNPKRKASHRTITVGPRLAAVLKEWISVGLADSKPRELVGRDGVKRKVRMLFPSEVGTPTSYFNFYHRVWTPLLIAAGITQEISAGKEVDPPLIVPRYPPNVTRHFAASLWIDQGIREKALQRRMGHASIKTTMDTYGHLFRNQAREQEEAVAAEAALWAAEPNHQSS